MLGIGAVSQLPVSGLPDVAAECVALVRASADFRTGSIFTAGLCMAVTFPVEPRSHLTVGVPICKE